MSRTIRYNPYHKQHRRGGGRKRQKMRNHDCRPGAIPPDPYDDAAINKEVWMAELGHRNSWEQEGRTRRQGARFDGSERLPKCVDRRKARKEKQQKLWSELE